MKTRTDFVTNSSSSSFIIAKKYLDEEQIEAIHRHYELAIRMGMISADDKLMFAWNINENEDFIVGDVFMDNFSMSDFFEKIGVPEGRVSWGEYPFDLDDEFYDPPKDEPIQDWRNYLYED